jgi:hypothetical protein
MPTRHGLSEPQARAQARAWLEQQHTDAHELVVTLLHYVPEADRTRALSSSRPASCVTWPGCWPTPPTCARSPGPSSPTSNATCALSRRRRTVRNTTPPPSEASVTLRSARRRSGP